MRVYFLLTSADLIHLPNTPPRAEESGEKTSPVEKSVWNFQNTVPPCIRRLESNRSLNPSHIQWQNTDIHHKKYIQNPPAGYARREIERMRDNDILDMNYFLNEF